jgi:GT2 family glycosyltransferase
MNQSQTGFSMVIISKDNRDLLIKNLSILTTVLKSNLSNAQIIVVEATELAPIRDEAIRYIRIPLKEAGFSHQRNIGQESCRSEHIIFIDDDVEITRSWFSELTRSMQEDKDALGIMGAVFPSSPGIIGYCEGLLGHPGGGLRLHYFSKNKIIPLSEFSTCNTIIKKYVLDAVGGFDTRLKYGGEDTDLSIRIMEKFGKNRFRYDPNALVYHKPRNSIRKIMPWYIRRGKADAELFLSHSSHIKYLFSSSILLKIFPLVFAGWLLKSFLILIVAFFAWYALQLARYKFMFNYFYIYHFSKTKKVMTLFLFPLIKLLADLMFDLGRIFRTLKR